MKEWVVILSFLSLLIAIGTLLDKYYTSSRKSSKIRDLLIKYYVWIDDKTISINIRELIDSAFEIFVIPTLFYGGIFGLAYLINKTFAAVLFVIFVVPMAGVILLAAPIYAVIFIASISAFLYGVSRLILLHVLNRSTDSKQSPFSYLLTTLGVLVAIGKLVVDIVKYFQY